MSSVTVTEHDPHINTGATFSILIPPNDKRSWPLAISFTEDELRDVVEQGRDALVGKVV